MNEQELEDLMNRISTLHPILRGIENELREMIIESEFTRDQVNLILVLSAGISADFDLTSFKDILARFR